MVRLLGEPLELLGQFEQFGFDLGMDDEVYQRADLAVARCSR